MKRFLMTLSMLTAAIVLTAATSSAQTFTEDKAAFIAAHSDLAVEDFSAMLYTAGNAGSCDVDQIRWNTSSSCFDAGGIYTNLRLQAYDPMLLSTLFGVNQTLGFDCAAVGSGVNPGAAHIIWFDSPVTYAGFDLLTIDNPPGSYTVAVIDAMGNPIGTPFTKTAGATTAGAFVGVEYAGGIPALMIQGPGTELFCNIVFPSALPVELQSLSVE